MNKRVEKGINKGIKCIHIYLKWLKKQDFSEYELQEVFERLETVIDSISNMLEG